jgi:molecular chaperone Hsp33
MDAPQPDDLLTRFMFEGAAVRGALVTLAGASREILGRRPYPPALQRILAELLAAAALLASTPKFSGRLTVQLHGGGPVSLLVVECTEALLLRATAQWDAQRMRDIGTDATLADLAGPGADGRLVIALDPMGAGAIHQGIVALETASVARLVEHYLRTSEQLDSRLVVIERDGAAAGMLVQRMPGARTVDDAAWARATAQMAQLEPSALLIPEAPPLRIHALLPHEDVRVFPGTPARSHCGCSRKRAVDALRIAGQAEIESILAERGDVEVCCEFCGRRHVLGPDEARALFAGAPASAQ